MIKNNYNFLFLLDKMIEYKLLIIDLFYYSNLFVFLYYYLFYYIHYFYHKYIFYILNIKNNKIVKNLIKNNVFKLTSLITILF
jgi:hypothetical protein